MITRILPTSFTTFLGVYLIATLNIWAQEADPKAPAADASAPKAADDNATPPADDNATTVSDDNVTAPIAPFLSSDFFAGALEAAKAGGGDAMGTQRLIDVKSTKLTPSLAFSLAYNYSSNPEKNELPDRKQDSFNSVLSFMFNMGLGEYGVGDETLLTPSLMLMQMRTYNDPVKDYGTAAGSLRVFDVDVQIAGITVPIILPNDYTLSVGHTYVRPISFRNDNVLSYSNSPNVALTKILPLPTGDILSFTAGTSYSFSTGDTPAAGLETDIFDFLMAATGGSLMTDSPVNLQDAWTHNLNLSYIKPIGEKITLTPSVAVSMMEYTTGANEGREDTMYIAGLVGSYTISEWVNFSAATNYNWKRSNRDNLDYEDFIGGVTLGVNYAF
ncbi:MAG: hypothetical protein VB997_00945 [Opitutales bacterium]